MRPFAPFVDGYYDTADQMSADLRRRALDAASRRAREWEEIASIEQFEAHREDVRAAFLTAVGGLPAERTPLQAECTGTLDSGAYHIEKVVYQSLPGYYVTASLYVPHDLAGPTGAVLFVCGHSEAGKAEPVYQAVCADLAANGLVVLAIDPAGQGERFHYLDPATGSRIVGGCTTEHSHAGLQFALRGASIARYFIWDAMRGLDYLCSRPEVDPARLGVTGNSGGGTQTCLLLMAGEPRLAAAAPCSFVMALEAYLKTGQAQDAEQLVRGCFVDGPDHHDFITAIAPRPVLVGANLYDFFPIQGTREAVRRANRAYALYGAESSVDLACSPHTHAFSAHLRESVVNWMRRHLLGQPGDFRTAQPEVLPVEDLNCFSTGQVLLSIPDSLTVHDLNLAALCEEPAPPPTPATETRARLARTLGIADEPLDRPLDARVVLDEAIEGYRTEHVFLFSAPDIVLTGVMVHPRGCTPATHTELVLLPRGTADVAHEKARLEGMLAAGKRLFVFDPRGMGAVETRPVNPRGLWDDYGTEYRLASDAMLLGTSTLGLRVFDVLRGLGYLRSRPDCAAGALGVYGLGFGTLLGYLAAALDGRLQSVTVEGMLYSYRDLATRRYYDRQQYGPWAIAWGLLPSLDLPDLLHAIAPARLRLLGPLDASGLPASEAALRAAYLDRPDMAPLLGGWLPEVVITRPISPLRP